jgi:hypothetical protein
LPTEDTGPLDTEGGRDSAAVDYDGDGSHDAADAIPDAIGADGPGAYLDDDDEVLHRAATKVQAHYRGHLARRQVRALREQVYGAGGEDGPGDGTKPQYDDAFANEQVRSAVM